MGRPKRTDKDQPGEGRDGLSCHKMNPSQPIHSPPRPPTHSSCSAASAGFTPNSDAWSAHDLDDIPVDPTLRNITVQDLDFFDFTLPGGATPENESAGIHVERYLHPALDLSPGQFIPALTEDEVGGLVPTEPRNRPSRFPQMMQEILQELSDLNMELSRKLGATGGSTTNKFTSNHPRMGLTALPTLSDDNCTLSDAVVFMIRSLQTYHRLLVEILGSTAGPSHSTKHSPHDNPESSTAITSLQSSFERVESGDSSSHKSNVTGRLPRKRIRPDSGADFNPGPHQSSHSADLDMPTSFLLLSCHTNLIYICRDTFASIRGSLLTTTHCRINLFTISCATIDDILTPSDPDLQIIVLIQTVVRILDKIERFFGYPDDCEANSGSEECEGHAHTSGIPKCLGMILRNEGCEDGLADMIGTRALREEMREIHELVYKAV